MFDDGVVDVGLEVFEFSLGVEFLVCDVCV